MKGNNMAYTNKNKSKSNTKYMKFRGKVSYAKIYDPDEFMNEKSWKLNLHPDVDTIAKIKSAGILLKLRDPNEEKSGVAGKYFTFKRHTEREFNGVKTEFAPPIVLDKDNNKLVYYTPNEDGSYSQHGDRLSIGNGSLIEIDISVFGTERKGHRLNAVRILDLIEYTRPDDLQWDEVDEEDDLNDEIPFEIPVDRMANLVTQKTSMPTTKKKVVAF